MKKNCPQCGLVVDLDYLHPDSLDIPQSGEFVAFHKSCADSAARRIGARVEPEDVGNDVRAWIEIR